ncbi:hypothetical protein [Wolbachia endosymbiont of Trichogramma kaykai]|uniref:hypothetical protein n=1 Tax=Wolbachia endosymbiont of Trichogramma kaykai TaxID=444066 RepID=UPI0038917579
MQKTYNRELLSNQRVVDGINSMDYSKLKILCKYHNKFSHKGIEELLLDESIVNHINDYDDEMFRSMLNDAPAEHNILEILKVGRFAISTMNSKVVIVRRMKKIMDIMIIMITRKMKK